MNDEPDDHPVIDVQTPDQNTVNYVFPVEVTVVGALTEQDHRDLSEGLWAAFGEALNQQSA